MQRRRESASDRQILAESAQIATRDLDEIAVLPTHPQMIIPGVNAHQVAYASRGITVMTAQTTRTF